MYKDKDKQREANRQAKLRQREREGMTITLDNVIPKPDVIPTDVIPERTAQGNIRVSKPGDPDYKPQCETTRAFEGITNDEYEFVRNAPKRGKDIKCFEDLPADVQHTIIEMSSNDGGITWDTDEHAKRTKAAIEYQHLFPDRYEPMSVFKRKL